MSHDARNCLADHDAPISMLSVKDKFFSQLTDKEQKYAHFMSKASHAGTRIVLRQVSHESESIFDLILEIDKNLIGEYPKDIEETALYLDYVAQFLANLGNYKAFGNSKFIPACSKQFFFRLLELASLDVNKIPTAGPFDTLRELVEIGIYSLEGNTAFLGYPADGYVSSYYLGEQVSSKDMSMLKDQVFGKLNILPENTRINKLSDNFFELLVASKSYHNTITDIYPESQLHLGNGINVQFKFGDHSREMGLIASYLEKAKDYAANEIQSKMLDEYIEHFTSGSSHAHKYSQKLWVKDLSPIIETNIGFIETYREPSGIIGEYESLVAIKNKERTAKFGAMVQNAEEFISLLPWDPEFEKPTFNPPDFTSLEVLTFTGSGIPAGINIPNYDDVRVEIGFKNVSLGNILSAAAKGSSKHPPSFISEKDRPLYEKYQGDSFEVQVGIHELLGHGSGKLLSELKNGFNFDKSNPPVGLDGQPISTYYNLGETWGSKFEDLAGPFEECRAEVIAMYLITNRKLLKIFGFTKAEDQENIIYAAYLQMCRAGLMALEYWDPATGKWGQPHMQARFSIMKTFLKHSPNPNLLKIATQVDDLYIELNQSLIETAGHECMEDYLKHLHIYKCSGDFEQGSAYFIERSTVTPDLAKLRQTVIRKRLPRRQFVQANTLLKDQKITLQEYPETPMGLLQSFVEREV